METVQRQPVVHFPSELESQEFTGKLYGYYHPESNEYNIISWGNDSDDFRKPRGAAEIGTVVFAEGEGDIQSLLDSQLLGVRTESGLAFYTNQGICHKEAFDHILNIFSRNVGILETDRMINKCVIISGCGSVGSLVAVELARAGVGKFVLFDNDTIAYHNLCRHQCGVQDVGRFKVNVVKDRILQINPLAEVKTFASIIENIRKEIFDESCGPGSLIIGCADNREGDIYASKLSCLYKVPFVSIGFWERAFAGEIFYSIPGEMPCYACPFEHTGHILSNKASTNRRIYTTEEDIARVNFEPGISADISFVTIIAIKLIIDILNQDSPAYTPRLLNHLSQFTLVCNTNDIRLGGEQAEIFSYPLQVTTSIKIDYEPPCPPCRLV
jgi:molybdopterin/thiamine biosynthesis adenylyltransferase